MSNSTSAIRSRKPSKPAKPYEDFPLFPHATGRWAKKIRGKLHYFGPWDDPDAALTKYLAERDYLHAGKRPPANQDGLEVRELANRFLTAKKHLLETGELSPRSWQDYHATCERVVKCFGKSRLVEDLDASDFQKLRSELAKTRGPVALGNEIQRVRSLFKYAYDEGLSAKPTRFGQSFAKPSRKTLRKARAKQTAENGKRMFEAAELRQILDYLAGAEITLERVDEETGEPVKVQRKADPALRAMVLLGINAGLGNTDCSELPRSALDLEGGWLDYPRPKTGIDRRCPLWPETVAALREALAVRPAPKDQADAGLVFLTRQGRRWVRLNKSSTPNDEIGKSFAKTLAALDLKRPGLGFYALRHTFETVAGESADQVAVDAIMGHVDGSMAAAYREGISDERLQKACEQVRSWLFPADEQEGGSDE